MTHFNGTSVTVNGMSEDLNLVILMMETDRPKSKKTKSQCADAMIHIQGRSVAFNGRFEDLRQLHKPIRTHTWSL